ncbi:MAG: hypothetical protein ABR953_08340 [Candidatus Acidiferrales bacterium]|jgi:hypothetical protein
MSQKSQNRGAEIEEAPARTGKARKVYERPAFQHERVFETMALACGKLSPTQFQCRFNRKNS